MNAALQAPDLASVRQEISAMGAKFGPEEMLRTRALFKPLVEALPHSSTPLIADLPYGPDSRHRLDVAPARASNAPVVIFFHGGGFVAGDKNSDGVFYCNVIRYFAAHGYLALAANYRLAPAAGWPAGSEDISAVIRWARAHAAEYGGDPGSLCLLGQSAGASHIATWLFNPALAGDRGDIRAAVLMSGFYRAEPPLAGGPLAYFGADASLYAQRSVTNQVTPGHVPILLTVAQYDPAPLAEQTLGFASALNRTDGSPPRLVWGEGENHVSAVHGFGLGDDVVGWTVRQFFASVS